jgi:hypothetical protein
LSQAKPEKSCNDTVFKYVISEKDLSAAKKQILKVAGSNPVIFIETELKDKMVELMVMAASLTPSVAKELNQMQDSEVMVKKIASAEFDNQVSFNFAPKKKS